MHASLEALEAGVDAVRLAPSDHGRVEMIVRRPAIDEREILEEGVLDTAEGLIGDNWRVRGSRKTPDGSAHPGKQLTLMNARFAAVVAGARERWPLAGDQLYVDFDLSAENCPPGTLLAVGTAVIEISDQPHTGCAKFATRFGPEALRFIASPVGRKLRLRGINARVVAGGRVSPGAAISKLPGRS